MFGNRRKSKKIRKSLAALCEIGHFKNVQKSKGPPDLYQKSRFLDLEHNAANCVFLYFLLLP